MLPPVGDPICLRALLPRRSVDNDSAFTNSWVPFASGTAALAAVMHFIRAEHRYISRVLVPAYSCPDIAAAAIHAGLSLEFVDAAPGCVMPSESRWVSALGDAPGSAVCVDLFGAVAPIPDSMQVGHYFIRDRAQGIIGPVGEIPRHVTAVVGSFGRGKPASLMGGGCAWVRDSDRFGAFVNANFTELKWLSSYAMLVALAHNIALSPSVFGLIRSIPWLHVGETRLSKLHCVSTLPRAFLVSAHTQLMTAVARNGIRLSNTRHLIAAAESMAYFLPSDIVRSGREQGLNRIPIICHDETQAQMILSAGRRWGISEMYSKTLPEYLGWSEQLASDHVPNAYAASRRLLTLPTHTRVDSRARDSIIQVLKHAC